MKNTVHILVIPLSLSPQILLAVLVVFSETPIVRCCVRSNKILINEVINEVINEKYQEGVF